MEEILHQLMFIPLFTRFIHPRWCRISEPSTVVTGESEGEWGYPTKMNASGGISTIISSDTLRSARGLLDGPKSGNKHGPGDSNWPFHPLVGGHFTIQNGHLTIPKRSQRRVREKNHEIFKHETDALYRMLGRFKFWKWLKQQQFAI